MPVSQVAVKLIGTVKNQVDAASTCSLSMRNWYTTEIVSESKIGGACPQPETSCSFRNYRTKEHSKLFDSRSEDAAAWTYFSNAGSVHKTVLRCLHDLCNRIAMKDIRFHTTKHKQTSTVHLDSVRLLASQ